MEVPHRWTPLLSPPAFLGASREDAVVAFTWHGVAATEEVVNAGPLALIQPLLDKLDIEAIIDRHLPPDPQQEHSHGQVLCLLLAARLCQPTALVNIEQWAQKTGADILWNLPADKLNDDRLGRALDAFFEQRHSILGSVTAQALRLTGLSLERLHFDPTHLLLSGAYECSAARPDPSSTEHCASNAQLPPAHICHGYTANSKMIQAGQVAIVDDRGAVPVFLHCLDGNRNGHPAIHQTFDLLRQHLPLPESLLMISDRGTCSIEHIARLHRHGHQVLCTAQWQDYRALYDAHAEQLHWHQASFLSSEQQRRRRTDSALPRDHYELAVLRHTFVDPTDQHEFDGRLIFAYSTADERESRQRRHANIAKIQAGLETLQAKLLRGHPQCTTESISKQVQQLLGNKQVGRYFRWQLVSLTAAEQAALPQPKSGHRRASHRLEFHLDSGAAQQDERYDGLSVLLTTASRQCSADQLFTKYREQNYVELLHHQWKTPLAVSPIFLKSPSRVEALICLLQLALQAYQILERLYRQSVPNEASQPEQRTTAESLLRIFNVYGLLVTQGAVGRVVYTTRLSNRQRQILQRLHFPTPAQTLTRILQPEPSG
jgi:transposase